MNCKNAEDLMMSFFDGCCTDVETAQLRQHIKSCGACGQMFAQLEEAFDHLRQEEDLSIPPDFEASVMERIHDVERVRKAKTSKILVWAYNLATVVAIILLMLFAANLKEMDLSHAASRFQEYVQSFTGLVSSAYELSKDLCALVVRVAGVMFKVNAMIVEKYAYILLAVFAILFALYRAAQIIVHQDRRGNR